METFTPIIAQEEPLKPPQMLPNGRFYLLSVKPKMLKTRSCTAGSKSEASKMDGSNEAGEASLEKGVKENIETKEKSLQKPTNEKALDTVGESLNSKTDEFQIMLMLDNADDNDE